MIAKTSKEKMEVSNVKRAHKMFVRENPILHKEQRDETAHQILQSRAPRFDRFTLTLKGINRATWG